MCVRFHTRQAPIGVANPGTPVDRKYQIFVSSTYEDLRTEREAVIRAILEFGHFPVGMEMFSAADEQAWTLIKKQIDDADYYVVVVAHRYGSADAVGTSFTEKEYDYAHAQGIPTLGFVIADDVNWNPAYVDHGEARLKIDAFKEKIKKKHVSFWRSRDDLPGRVSIALAKQFNVNPRVGWAKADKVPTADVAGELTRLSKENAELRSALAAFEVAGQAAARERESIETARRVLPTVNRNLSFFYVDGTDWENKKPFSLQVLFSLIGSELLTERTLEEICRYLGLALNPDQQRMVRSEYPTAANSVRNILADFHALDLVEPSKRKRSVGDTNEYWTLAEKGRRLLKQIRIERMPTTAEYLLS